jgi:cysteine desulfurase
MGVIFLDNAATTPLEPRVKEEMVRMMDNFGNPSSTHVSGRGAKIEVEVVRKRIAQQIGAEPGEIFFTSGGTEADNMALFCSVRDLGVQRIISTTIEHHAVGHPIEFMVKRGEVEAVYLGVNEYGDIDLAQLEEFLKEEPKTLVSLMYANNEIGNLHPVGEISALCQKYGALFHSDTVQAMGHLPISVKDIHYDFLTCSAHKIHGPKGVGFAYVRSGLKIKPLIQGGAQERNMRAGTENTIGICGLGKAFEIATSEMEEDKKRVEALKSRVIKEVQDIVPGVRFFGRSSELENSLYTVLSIAFPKTDNDMLTFSFDIKGISVSGGSACTSGSNQGSHVIRALGEWTKEYQPVRVSFSKFNTEDCIEGFLGALKEIYAKHPIA